MSPLFDAAGFLAQQAAPSAPAGGAAPSGMPIGMLVAYGLFIAGLFYLMSAPQRKKQKEHEKLVGSLQTGDEIVTSGGIFGVITNVKEDRLVVRIADNTKIELGKAFVQTVVKPPAPAAKK